jgi:hypothetical protein
MKKDIYPKTLFASVTGKGIPLIQSRSNVCSASLSLSETCRLTNLSDAANDADCAVRMYRKICEVADRAGKTLTLSKYTTDLKADYDSGKLSMITTSATVTPKNATAELTPQERKTYTLWHTEELSLPELCAALRSKDNPLKESTVM